MSKQPQHVNWKLNSNLYDVKGTLRNEVMLFCILPLFLTESSVVYHEALLPLLLNMNKCIINLSRLSYQ